MRALLPHWIAGRAALAPFALRLGLILRSLRWDNYRVCINIVTKFRICSCKGLPWLVVTQNAVGLQANIRHFVTSIAHSVCRWCTQDMPLSEVRSNSIWSWETSDSTAIGYLLQMMQQRQHGEQGKPAHRLLNNANQLLLFLLPKDDKHNPSPIKHYSRKV